MFQVQISTQEDLEVIARPTDEANKRAALEAGSLKFVSSDPSVIEDGVVVESEEDDGQGGTAKVYTTRCRTTGSVGGVATLTVTADADLGSGVVELSDSIEVTLAPVTGQAQQLGLSIRGVPKV